MKIIDIVVKQTNNELENNFQFKHAGTRYFVRNNRIFYYDNGIYEKELTNIKILCLNDEVEILEDKPKEINKINFMTANTQKEKNRMMKDAINELTEAVNYLLKKEDK